MPSPAEPSPTRTFQAGALSVRIYAQLDDLATAAALAAHANLAKALEAQGRAAVVLAAAASQVLFLEVLTGLSGLDWSKVTALHMDEYLGLGTEHPASIRRSLREQVERRARPGTFHYLQGEASQPLEECARYARLLQSQPVDLCCLGIGENGHLAFNDPHVADFHDPHTVKLVQLDEASRRQQVGEGAFPNLEAVPQYAYTVTIPALCAARQMICVVPERRKAQAVRNALLGPISPACPASILRQQPHCTLYLEAESAGLL